MSVVSVVCCQVDVSVRSYHSSRGVLPTAVRSCGDLETSRMRRPWSAGAVMPRIKIKE